MLGGGVRWCACIVCIYSVRSSSSSSRVCELLCSISWVAHPVCVVLSQQECPHSSEVGGLWSACLVASIAHAGALVADGPA